MSDTFSLPWKDIDTVLLDMDGTLLDLNFDTHFWREHVPMRYAEIHGVNPEQARTALHEEFDRIYGTLNWYCIDHWSSALDLDIAGLKVEVSHLIAIHPYVQEFLIEAREAGKRVVLVTNAHRKSLQLKMEKTELEPYLDRLICSHDFGKAKEEPGFWEALRETEPFDPKRTVLLDDSHPVLHSAANYGIRYPISIVQPDTQQPPRVIDEFAAISSFSQLLPVQPS